MLTEAEVAKALSVIKQFESVHRSKAIALEILIWTGMRKGELSGLLITDIDLDREIIKVTKSRVYVKGYGVVERDMTKNGISREIPIEEELLPKLKSYLEWYEQEKSRLGSYWKTDGLIVNLSSCTHITPRTIGEWVDEWMRAANISKNITPHKLRHTAASIMLSNKVDSLSVAGILGHNVATLEKYYAHSFEEKKRKGISAYGKALRDAAMIDET